MTTETTPPSRPDLYVFHTQPMDNGKTYYTEVGAMWKHRKGDGYSLRLNLMPTHGFDGSLVAFPPGEESKDGEQAA